MHGCTRVNPDRDVVVDLDRNHRDHRDHRDHVDHVSTTTSTTTRPDLLPRHDQRWADPLAYPEAMISLETDLRRGGPSHRRHEAKKKKKKKKKKVEYQKEEEEEEYCLFTFDLGASASPLSSSSSSSSSPSGLQVAGDLADRLHLASMVVSWLVHYPLALPGRSGTSKEDLVDEDVDEDVDRSGFLDARGSRSSRYISSSSSSSSSSPYLSLHTQSRPTTTESQPHSILPRTLRPDDPIRRRPVRAPRFSTAMWRVVACWLGSRWTRSARSRCR